MDKLAACAAWLGQHRPSLTDALRAMLKLFSTPARYIRISPARRCRAATNSLGAPECIPARTPWKAGSSPIATHAPAARRH